MSRPPAPARRRDPSRWLAPLSVSSVLLAVACEPSTAPPRPLTDDLKSHVTAEAARGLSPDGHFALSAPESRAYPQVSGAQAGELALAFARTFGPHMRAYLEKDYGGTIDFEALRVGSPAYYAATPFHAVPREAGPALRNAYGPYYLVYLVDAAGTPVLTVSVAGHTEASVANGRLTFPQAYGNDFVAHGIRPGEGFSMPPLPEQAVRIASAAAGARAVSAPTLVLGSREYHPVHARWKVTLDRAVEARAGDRGEVRRTNVVYVGLRGQLFVPALDQPAHEAMSQGPGRGPLQVGRQPDRPTVFEHARFSNR